MGKTTFGLALAKSFAENHIGTCVVSLEMHADSLANRLLASMANIPYRSMRRADISEDQFRAIVAKAQKTQEWPLVITPPRIRTVESIFAEIARVKQSMDSRVPGGLRVVFVDYLQLVRSKGKDEVEIVANASRAMKAWAQLFGITIVAMAQITRAVADRDEKRPRMSDIRGSAQIEMDADIIAMIHRDHYYLEREGPPRGKNGKVRDEDRADYEAALSACKNQMDVILAKHRHDGIDEVKLGCDMGTNRVWDLNDFNRQMEF
jgi:replicative DNA helicase